MRAPSSAPQLLAPPPYPVQVRVLQRKRKLWRKHENTQTSVQELETDKHSLKVPQRKKCILHAVETVNASTELNSTAQTPEAPAISNCKKNNGRTLDN